MTVLEILILFNFIFVTHIIVHYSSITYTITVIEFFLAGNCSCVIINLALCIICIKIVLFSVSNKLTIIISSLEMIISTISLI